MGLSQRLRALDERVVPKQAARTPRDLARSFLFSFIGGASALVVLVAALVAAGMTDRLYVLIGPGVGVAVAGVGWLAASATARRR